jgi:Ras-related protein Rab-1A
MNIYNYNTNNEFRLVNLILILISDYLFKILLLGDSGVGKSCIILRYTENQFSQNLMNSIGVDFKLKNINVDDKNIKLQIVLKLF